jgi:hypothetical protein
MRLVAVTRVDAAEAGKNTEKDETGDEGESEHVRIVDSRYH